MEKPPVPINDPKENPDKLPAPDKVIPLTDPDKPGTGVTPELPPPISSAKTDS